MWSVMNSGPVPQFKPTDSRSACAIEDVQRIGGLPGQHGAHGFDGAGDHHREYGGRVRAPGAGWPAAGLDVARVLAGFEQQDVGAAIDQRLGLIVEILLQMRRR